MLLSIGKAIYLTFFLKSLDITENKDICMFVGFTVMDKGLFCQEITFFVSLLLDLVPFLGIYLFILHMVAKN